MPEPFTCPRCGAVSHHPTDKAEGYCGRCHDWTAPTDWRDEVWKHRNDLLRRMAVDLDVDPALLDLEPGVSHYAFLLRGGST